MMVRFVVPSLALALSASIGIACCMVPRDYRGTIGQNAQQAVLIHHDGREELVLGIDYRITPEPSSELSVAVLPRQFVWVITVPSEPDSYAIADPKLFEDMFHLAEELLAPKAEDEAIGRESRRALPAGVELGRRVQVGPYDIQPVRALGRQALAGLNTWLEANGFPTEDPSHMAYFVDNKFTFLCVRVVPEAGKSAVALGGAIPPLHLSFASQRPYYPLKFSSRQGVFDVNLYVLTKKKLDYKAGKSTLERLNWANRAFERNVPLSRDRMPESLAAVLAKSRVKAGEGPWLLSNIRGERVNQGNTIATWTEDIFLSTGG